jgi:uncharacterized protein
MRHGVARVLWVLGWPARMVVLGVVQVYRHTVGPMFAGRCRFYPSCSNYALGAVRTHGAFKGSVLAAWRLLRCSPLTEGGIDPVPDRGRWRPAADRPTYDTVIPEGGRG